MEEQRCSECSDSVSEEEKACHKFEEPITQPPEIPKSKQSVPTSVLWLAAVLIIIGLVVVTTLVGYVAFSVFSAEGEGTFFTAKPERESAPQTKISIVDEQYQQDKKPLIGLSSKAPKNDYIVLKEELTAQRDADKIFLRCAVQNISEVVCTRVGVEVEFYNATGDFVGSSSSWEYRDIQPGEVVELNFDTKNGYNIQSYYLAKIGGMPAEEVDNAVAQGEEVGLEDNSDELIHLTPEKIIKAKGDDPEGWVAQQEGKEFIVTGPLLDVSASENGQVRLVKVGRGDGACYVFMLSPEFFDGLDQITQGTEVCMRGVCVVFSDQPQAFILMNGALMN